MASILEKKCEEHGVRLTDARRIIAQVLSESSDHPDVQRVHKRAAAKEGSISVATVYRTLRLFAEIGVLEKHDFKAGRARYEVSSEGHHDHLIDIENDCVIEFQDDMIEELQRKAAERLGYRLVDHRLELYGVPLKKNHGKVSR